MRANRRQIATAALLAGATVTFGCSGESSSSAPAVVHRGTGTVCVDTTNSLVDLGAYAAMLNRATPCISLFNDAASSWSGWQSPWFLHHPDPRFAFSSWVAGDPVGRLLVIAQSMVPSDAPADWRTRGAHGEYDGHVTALARALVGAGLGSSVIRLGHEMNGTWYRDAAGTTAAERSDYRTYWARVVRVMRSVPGAHFQFDWNVATGVGTGDLGSLWPGDDVVDLVGLDVYDSAPHAAAGSSEVWVQLRQGPFGADAIAAFAQKHHKLLTIPELGLRVASGDDARFVEQVASFAQEQAVGYVCYFDTGTQGTAPLQATPRAREAFIARFGGHGT